MVSEANPELQLTLEGAVGEVLDMLTGIDLQYDPLMDRYRSVTRALNRAMRHVALEHEWAWYASTEAVGTVVAGDRVVTLPSTLRPRQTGDDAVRLVDENGNVAVWAYFLPRDAIAKYGGRNGLWVAAMRGTLLFSRDFEMHEAGWSIEVPVMREPKMFRLPPAGEAVPQEILDQPIDFQYPDLVLARAAFLYAQTDPLMQPRVQTLEAGYKDLMYQILERDDRSTDSPYLNDFLVPVQSGITGGSHLRHNHPHADDRRYD